MNPRTFTGDSIIVVDDELIIVVDKEAIIPAFANFYASDRKSIHINRWKDSSALKAEFPFYWLIIATIGKRLEGVPLIELTDDDLDSKAAKSALSEQRMGLPSEYVDPHFRGYKEGYKAASKDKNWTDDDVLHLALGLCGAVLRKEVATPEEVRVFVKHIQKSLQRKVPTSITLEYEEIWETENYPNGDFTGRKYAVEKLVITNTETNTVTALSVEY